MTKACTCFLISKLVFSLFSTLTDALINEEIITDALGTRVCRLATSASWDCLGTRLAYSFIKVVTLFAFDAARFVTLVALAILNEATLLTLAITHKILSSTDTAATRSAGLALLSETRLAADALTI